MEQDAHDRGTPPARRSRGEVLALAITLAALVGIAVGAIHRVDYLPTHDGPQHIYTVHAKQHLGDVTNGYARYLEAGRPLTAQGFASVFGPLDRVMPWRSAYATTLTILLIAWILGAVWLAHRVAPARVWLGVALAGAGFSWSLYMGFFSYYVALTAGLGVLGFALAHPLDNARSRALLSALLLVQGWLHVFPAVLTAAIALGVWVVREPASNRRRVFAQAIGVGAPLGLLTALILFGRAEQSELLGRSEAGWEHRFSGFTLGLKMWLGGPAWRVYGLPITILALAGWSLWRWPTAISRRDGALFAVGSALAIASFALPLHLIGWDFFSVRFLPFAFVCLLLACPIERLGPRGRTACATLCAGFALASQLWAFDYNAKLAAEVAPALAGLDLEIERSGPRLAVVMEPGLASIEDPHAAAMPFAVPLLNLGQLYATEQGGFPADTFAISPATHQVLLREDAPPFPAHPDRAFVFALQRESKAGDAKARERYAAFAASFAGGFEDLVWYGRDDDLAMLEARGFRFDHAEGGLAVARLEGCPLALEVEAPKGVDLEIELGWFPLLDPRQRRRLHASEAGHITFRGSPCGPVWLRVRDAAALHAGGLSCAGADGDDRLVLRDTRATPTVRCRLEAS